MPHWAEKIELNKAISLANDRHDLSRHEEQVPDEVKALLNAELGKSLILCHFVQRVNACKSIAALNREIAKIYDQADQHRVWCGFH